MSEKELPISPECPFCNEGFFEHCVYTTAAVRGPQALYQDKAPLKTDWAKKDFGINYSSFNVNGRNFGASSTKATYEDANIYNVNLEKEYGKYNKIKLATPIILPAIMSLNWRDYFSGAAMAGVSCVIGEGSVKHDPDAEFKEGKIVKFDLLSEMLDCFNKYYRGYGQIILQCNVEDDLKGLPDLAVSKYGAQAIEFKFNQAAKAIPSAVLCSGGYEEALKLHNEGIIVRPNPSTDEMRDKFKEGCCPNFYKYEKLPLWDKKYMVSRIKSLKEMGMKNTYFKISSSDEKDIETILRIASAAEVDMITFDGSNGSGLDTNITTNQWGLPTVCLEKLVVNVISKLENEGLYIPAVSISGGIAKEEDIFKALAIGDGKVTAVGTAHNCLLVATSSKRMGQLIEEGIIPKAYQQYGTTKEEIFSGLPDLKYIYGKDAVNFPAGAIGLFSYINKLSFGIKHFSALNRKFDINSVNKEDIIPLNNEARCLLNGTWFDF